MLANVAVVTNDLVTTNEHKEPMAKCWFSPCFPSEEPWSLLTGMYTPNEPRLRPKGSRLALCSLVTNTGFRIQNLWGVFAFRNRGKTPSRSE